jgi:methylmalonic aciduria homocystinuria type C protein
MAALERAQATARGLPTHDQIASEWSNWVAVRDACPVGRAERYDDAQVRYHYTKDRRILERALADSPRRRGS